MTNIKSTVNEVLFRGVEDWIQAAELASVVMEVYGATNRDEIRQISIEIIRHVLKSDLMEIGDCSGEVFRFHKWEMSDSDALAQVEAEWLEIGSPNLWEICWLSNTVKGNEVAKDLDQKISRGVKSLLIQGVDGLIVLSKVASIAKSVVGETTEDEIKWFSARMIYEVTRLNLMDIGDLQGAGDFCKWDVMDFEDEPREHVQKVWRELGRNPIPGEICCLRITSKGREMAEELKRQKANEP